VPSGPTRRTRWLPVSAIRNERPSGDDRTRRGRFRRAWVAGPLSPPKPPLAAPVGPLPATVVMMPLGLTLRMRWFVGVGDEEAAVGGGCHHPLREVELRDAGEAAVAGEARRAGAGDRVDGLRLRGGGGGGGGGQRRAERDGRHRAADRPHPKASAWPHGGQQDGVRSVHRLQPTIKRRTCTSKRGPPAHLERDLL